LTLRERLDDRINRKHLLTHSFYTDWQSGKLTLEDLRIYAAQYYWFEAALPTVLSTMHSRCASPEIRQMLLGNLWDEEHGERNHLALWLQFAESVGISVEEVQDTAASAETQHLVDTLAGIAGTASIREGIAALYAYERQVPEVATEKIRGLKEFYGVDAPEATMFFEVHKDLDRAHADAAFSALGNELDPETERAVTTAVDSSLNALWGFLDGVDRLRHSA
jgi:pyrroloquinoline-quinone synthase